MKRREFVKSSLAVGAATILSNPKSARGAVANERLRLGLIGCGARSDRVCSDMLRHPGDDVRFEYCCDVNISNAENRAKQLTRDGVAPKIVQDARAVFDDKAVDAVVLITPDHWHALHTIWACQAGKDVYVEKPLSKSPFEGLQMTAAAKKYGRVVAAGNQTRSAEYCRNAKRLIQEGFLGDIEFVRVNNIWSDQLPTVQTGVSVPQGLDWDRWLGPAPYREYSPTYTSSLVWGYFWDFGNGLLATQGVHQIDIARWILGLKTPRSCYTAGGLDKKRLEDMTPTTSSTVFDFGSLIMNVEQTMRCPHMLETDWEVRESDMHPYWFQNSTRIEIFGSKYLMVIGRLGAGWQIFDRTKQRQPVVKSQEYGNYSRLHLAHTNDFIDAVRERREPNSPVEECRLSTLLVQYANISLRAGGVKLEIDEKTGEITNCPEARRFWRPEFRKEYDVPEIK